MSWSFDRHTKTARFHECRLFWSNNAYERPLPRAGISERNSKKVSGPLITLWRAVGMCRRSWAGWFLWSRRAWAAGETELELRAILRPDYSLGMKLLSSLSSPMPGSPYAALVSMCVHVYVHKYIYIYIYIYVCIYVYAPLRLHHARSSPLVRPLYFSALL